MHKDLLSLEDLTRENIDNIIKLSTVLKSHRYTLEDKPLTGKTIALIFAKSSTRTRVSFEVGIKELGGSVIYLDQGKTQLGRGETIEDTAKVLSRYVHGIVIRTYKHQDIVELAQFATVPVINALTDKYHPCQVLADLLTIYEYSEKLDGIKMTYLGDGECNMANSLILGCKLAGIDLTITSPDEFKPNEDVMNSPIGSGFVKWEKDPVKACKDADYLYTDVWVSMGCEDEAKKRLKILKPYQLNNDLMEVASDNVKILHCLPAHRGEEVTADVIDSHNSIVFEQAENRLHAQKALLFLMMAEKHTIDNLIK